MLKSLKLRNLFESDKLIYVMGAHNALSAKYVEKNHFDCIWASGLEISTSYAVPDANILTMTQYLEKSTELSEATEIPVISDCDTGYGNSNNVIHLVRKYEAAGIAAVCIEDKLFPKVNSFVQGRQELAPIGEFVGKIMAAKSAQTSTNFMVIARVEALIAGWGEEEALLRASKYVEAGADAILIHSKNPDPEEIVSFCRKWKKKAPLVIVPTKFPTIMTKYSEKELLDLGIKVVIFANHGIRAAMKAMDEVMAKISKTHETLSIDENIVPMEEVFEIQGMIKMKEEEKLYLKSKKKPFTSIFLAAGEPKDQEDLAPLLRDRPTAFLDINGEPLIQRNISTLNQLGSTDIHVVTGYQKEQFKQLEKVHLINNEEYEKDVLSSFLLAGESVKDTTLVAFADILFDRSVIKKLLRYGIEEDLVLLADATFRKMQVRNKKLDLLITDNPPDMSHRHIDDNSLRNVIEIGSNIDDEKAHYEFIGLSLWNPKSMNFFKETLSQMQSQNPTETITFNQVLQEMIKKNFPVRTLEVSSGWIEIHNFENYKSACAQYPKGVVNA